MKGIYLFAAILFLFISSSCESIQESKNQSNLIKVTQLNSEIIKEDIVHKPATWINVADTFLIMVRQNEPMVRIYSTNTNKLLGEFGRKGGGRNDFEAPVLIKFSEGQLSDKPIVAIYDYLKGRLSFFDILAFFNDSENYLFHEKIPVNKFGGIIGFVYSTSKKYLFVNHNAYVESEINRFTVFNRETGQMKFVPLSPPTEFEVHEQINELVYKSLPAYNEDRGLIAAIPKFLGRIDFFNENLEFQFSSVYRNNEDNGIALSSGTIEKNGQMVSSLYNYKGNVLTYTYTSDCIIILCNEDKYGDVYDGGTAKMYLRVFNWEGEQLAVFSLKANVTPSISYDYIHNRLYLYDSYKDEDNLMMYDLPTF